MLALLLGLCAVQTPRPWSGLWLLVPVAVAVSMLAGWRFGARGVWVPIGLFGAAIAIAGPFALWSWWVPMASLSGLWMGLREEGGGPAPGERLWMLLPLLLLAASVPWAVQYPQLVTRVDQELRGGDKSLLEMMRSMATAVQLRGMETTLAEQADLRGRALPHVLPTVLFVWGPGRILPVKVTSLTITEKLYDDLLLNPIHAEAQIGLQVLTPEELNYVTGPLAEVAKGAYVYSQGLRQALAIANLANSVESAIGMLPI